MAHSVETPAWYFSAFYNILQQQATKMVFSIKRAFSQLNCPLCLSSFLLLIKSLAHCDVKELGSNYLPGGKKSKQIVREATAGSHAGRHGLSDTYPPKRLKAG